jgi:hypothetical protein
MDWIEMEAEHPIIGDLEPSSVIDSTYCCTLQRQRGRGIHTVDVVGMHHSREIGCTIHRDP